MTHSFLCELVKQPLACHLSTNCKIHVHVISFFFLNLIVQHFGKFAYCHNLCGNPSWYVPIHYQVSVCKTHQIHNPIQQLSLMDKFWPAQSPCYKTNRCNDGMLTRSKWCQTAQTYLFLKSFQGLKLQASQLDMDVFGDIWDEVGQDELEGQQSMLETQQQQPTHYRSCRCSWFVFPGTTYYSRRLRKDVDTPPL